MKFEEIRNRVTGISCPFFGISWQPEEANCTIAKRVITYLEDRRVLYSPYNIETPDYCVQSVIKIREYLTTELQNIKNDNTLSEYIRSMRAACRKFLNSYEKKHLYLGMMDRFGKEEWLFSTGFGEFRGAIGNIVANIAVGYGINIEGDLASIIPEDKTL